MTTALVTDHTDLRETSTLIHGDHWSRCSIQRGYTEIMWNPYATYFYQIHIVEFFISWYVLVGTLGIPLNTSVLSKPHEPPQEI